MIRIRLCPHFSHIAGTDRYDIAEPERMTVQIVLARLLTQHPSLSVNILSDMGLLRRDVAVFLNSKPLRDPAELSEVLLPECTVYMIHSPGPPVGMCWSTDWRARRLAIPSEET